MAASFNSSPDLPSPTSGLTAGPSTLRLPPSSHPAPTGQSSAVSPTTSASGAAPSAQLPEWVARSVLDVKNIGTGKKILTYQVLWENTRKHKLMIEWTLPAKIKNRTFLLAKFWRRRALTIKNTKATIMPQAYKKFSEMSDSDFEEQFEYNTNNDTTDGQYVNDGLTTISTVPGSTSGQTPPPSPADAAEQLPQPTILHFDDGEATGVPLVLDKAIEDGDNKEDEADVAMDLQELAEPRGQENEAPIQNRLNLEDLDTPADESFENWHLLEDNESEEEVEIAPLPQGGFAAQLAPPPPMEIDDVMEDAREDGANEDAEDVQQPAPPVPNAPLPAPENGVALHPVPPLRHSITQMPDPIQEAELRMYRSIPMNAEMALICYQNENYCPILMRNNARTGAETPADWLAMVTYEEARATLLSTLFPVQ